MIFDALQMRDPEGNTKTREEIEAVLDEHLGMEMWQNSRYCVLINRNPPLLDNGPEVIHLSIRRNDRQVPGPERWRDLQRVKNELIGPEHEAVELYPSESRVLDAANQMHLWVLESPDYQFPFGFQEGGRYGPTNGPAVQRPFTD